MNRLETALNIINEQVKLTTAIQSKIETLAKDIEKDLGFTQAAFKRIHDHEDNT